MPDPVIIDDGGSTRIKQLKSPATTGRMDDLLEVDTVAVPPQSTDFALGPFTQISLICISSAGVIATPLPNPAGATVPLPIPLLIGEGFTAFSDNGQRIDGTVVNRVGQQTGGRPGTATDLQITIRSLAANRPIVEAKHAGQRRYVVSNAGPIQRLVIRKTGPDETFDVPANTAYSMITVA